MSKNSSEARTSSISKPVSECRVCDALAIEKILDLGDQPPANSLREKQYEELDSVPLILCRCDKCGTLQLTENVDSQYLFGHYVWVTGTSRVAQVYSEVFSQRLLSRKQGKALRVIEIASNDGTFLRPFKDKGHKVLGIDPAKNIAAIASEEGIPTIPEFFGSSVAEWLIETHEHADIIFARNVIPHVTDPNDVIFGMAHCLKDDGIGAIEFHSAEVILRELHYDSIYHEHIFYHSLHSIAFLLEIHDLHIFDVQESPISGGSLVVYFSKSKRARTDGLLRGFEKEISIKINDLISWRNFAERCWEHRTALRSAVEDALSLGKSVIGYGASARSSTLLNYSGLGSGELDLVADKNPLKFRLYTPGTNLQIMPPEAAFAGNPDVILLLAWNFKEEILGEIREKFHWSGSVITPLPGLPQTIEI